MTTTAELTLLLEGTTPGPWKEWLRNDDQVSIVPERHIVEHPHICTVSIGAERPHGDANALLIAMAPTLAAENLRLLADIEKMRNVAQTLVDAADKTAPLNEALDFAKANGITPKR